MSNMYFLSKSSSFFLPGFAQSPNLCYLGKSWPWSRSVAETECGGPNLTVISWLCFLQVGCTSQPGRGSRKHNPIAHILNLTVQWLIPLSVLPDLLLPSVQGTVPSGFLWLFHPERRLKRQGDWDSTVLTGIVVFGTNWFSLCASPLCILDSPYSQPPSVCFNTFLGDSQLWVFWAPCPHAFLKIGCSTCLSRVTLG